VTINVCTGIQTSWIITFKVDIQRVGVFTPRLINTDAELPVVAYDVTLTVIFGPMVVEPIFPWQSRVRRKIVIIIGPIGPSRPRVAINRNGYLSIVAF
jgi:hypothetical protein